MNSSTAARPAGLTIFFPAYNDSGTIASLVITARRTAQKLTSDYEIIIVDDGSADATAEIADELRYLPASAMTRLTKLLDEILACLHGLLRRLGS